MCSGTVDAAVNGGIKNYETFITGVYRENNPEIAEDVDSHPSKKALVKNLISLLLEQQKLLEEGIQLHGRKCLESMQPLHAHIKTTYGKMKSELNAVLEMSNV